MALTDPLAGRVSERASFAELSHERWKTSISIRLDGSSCRLECEAESLREVCEWLTAEMDYGFATLVVEDPGDENWSLFYVFYKEADPIWVRVELSVVKHARGVPSISGLTHGPSADWHEREAEDLFGLTFEGHPRLGEFVLHEDWPEGVNPMRRDFDARHPPAKPETSGRWEPPTVVEAEGSFAMPIGPVFADFAESAHFLLETVGEDVIHTIPRFFYKYRGIEKLAEGQTIEQALLLAERFSGIAAFAHGLGFCQAVEAMASITVPTRAQAIRTLCAELERLRSHAATITSICHSTALAVATSQAALIEEDLLRLTCEIVGHRYFFGMLTPGGVTTDLDDETWERVTSALLDIESRLRELDQMLRYSSSFLDRLEEVGIITHEHATAYGLVGPIARASGIGRDMRRVAPYASYPSTDFIVPVEVEGDGYARLRIFFGEAEQSIQIIRQVGARLPQGPVRVRPAMARSGAALSAVEAPLGAAFHWVRIDSEGKVARYRVTPPSFINWHGFHLAAENFAFQDFPIILASFGLSNAECDR